VRHPALKMHNKTPCNAELPLSLHRVGHVTPSPLWFVRHHHPVPRIDPAAYEL
jgi:sulfite oxidase